MRKNLSSLLLLNLILVALTACVRAPAAPPPAIPAGDNQSQEQPADASGFTLTSPGLPDGGRLPAEYTCDGSSPTGHVSTLALGWSGAPAGTQSYAVIMHHIPGPNEVKWYWIIYNIPSSITSLPKNMTGIGSLGTNGAGRQDYNPPCSKGPGDKVYIFTVYALSAQPQFSVPAQQINRPVLLDAIKNITLASAELHVVYARP